MPYLSTEEARELFEKVGKSVPSDMEIELLLAQLKEGIDGWLGRSLDVQPYTETLKSNRRGIVLIDKKPLVEVTSVKYYEPRVLSEFEPRGPIAFTSSWKVGTGAVWTSLPYATFEVQYTAGYDPVPAAAKTAMSLLLARQAKSSGDILDISGFYDSEKKVSSMSLPGGLSKSFAPSQSNPLGANDGTVLDKILAPLLGKYRVDLKCV